MKNSEIKRTYLYKLHGCQSEIHIPKFKCTASNGFSFVSSTVLPNEMFVLTVLSLYLILSQTSSHSFSRSRNKQFELKHVRILKVCSILNPNDLMYIV